MYNQTLFSREISIRSDSICSNNVLSPMDRLGKETPIGEKSKVYVTK